jgi:peptidoglycan hydrolase-like protein with peptidoglycan-binding domain
LPIYPATQKTTHSAAGKTKPAAAAKAKRKASSSSTGKKVRAATTPATATRKTRRPGTATARTSGRKKAGTRVSGRAKTQKQSWRRGQMAPTPERYREIQQALIAKGCFQGEPNGSWGPDSTEALKNFQRNQNLEPNGKLDSLTLISLGLGPRREPLSSTAGISKTPPAAEGKEPQ